MKSDANLFELAGGTEGLRAVVESFYESVFSDVMIGFFFRAADKARLIEKEVELAARMLGGTHIPYTGKSMREAHAKHRIMGGQFERRLQLLREAMAKHDLPEPVREAWVAHTRKLRSQITRFGGSDCE